MAMQQETAADAAGLQRISTEYVEREDRIRLSGERVNGEVRDSRRSCRKLEQSPAGAAQAANL